jgi:hypothetical protein
MKRTILTTLAVAMASCTSACAASEEAFRKDVADKCVKAAADLFVDPVATVDPFGSATYGMALIRGKAKGAETTGIAAICVYDKKTKAVELGGELPAE